MRNATHASMKHLTLLVVGSLALCALAPTSAEAQRRRRASHADSVRFDVHVDLGWYGGFGAGFRVDIPIIPDGMIEASGVDDELVLSPGAEFLFWDYYDYDHSSSVGIAPLIALQWNFYLSDKWSVFPELGLALMIGDHWHHRHQHNNPDTGDHTHVFFDPFLGGGARYHFSARNALLLRVNWPAGLQIGITF
jgi:hypothetical protein